MEYEFSQWLLGHDNNWWRREPAQVNYDISLQVDFLRTNYAIEQQAVAESKVDFFISYANEDEAAAREIAGILDDLGKTYLVQYRDFGPENFVNAMNAAMQRSDRLIPLYSEHYAASAHCQSEWSYFYNLDPSSMERRILGFRFDDADLQPLMQQIVHRDVSKVFGSARRERIKEWINWKPHSHSRENVGEAVTAVLSPRVVANEQGVLDTAQDSIYDEPEIPAQLAEALSELKLMLETLRDQAINLSRMMQSAIGTYDREIEQNGTKARWNGLDRQIAILAAGLQNLEGKQHAEERTAIEQLIAAHDKCKGALKNADAQMRRVSEIPMEQLDQEGVRNLVAQFDTLFDEIGNAGGTTPALDEHVGEVVDQGREFEFSVGEPEFSSRPKNAIRRYIMYIGGIGLATLDALGNLASISMHPSFALIQAKGRALVEAFYKLLGL